MRVRESAREGCTLASPLLPSRLRARRAAAMEASASQLERASVTSLIAFGVAMGALHVLTGPDHLSAISVLAAGNAHSRWRTAWLGVRWGLGHRRARAAAAHERGRARNPAVALTCVRMCAAPHAPARG